MSAFYESELNSGRTATCLPNTTATKEPCLEEVVGKLSHRGSVLSPERPLDDAGTIHRRRRWSHEEKKSIVHETEGAEQSISGVARKYGIAPRLLFSWRRQMAQEMALTTRTGAKIVPIGMVKELQTRIHELEEQLDRQLSQINALTKALEQTAKKA